MWGCLLVGCIDVWLSRSLANLLIFLFSRDHLLVFSLFSTMEIAWSATFLPCCWSSHFQGLSFSFQASHPSQWYFFRSFISLFSASCMICCHFALSRLVLPLASSPPLWFSGLWGWCCSGRRPWWTASGSCALSIFEIISSWRYAVCVSRAVGFLVGDTRGSVGCSIVIWWLLKQPDSHLKFVQS